MYDRLWVSAVGLTLLSTCMFVCLLYGCAYRHSSDANNVSNGQHLQDNQSFWEEIRAAFVNSMHVCGDLTNHNHLTKTAWRRLCVIERLFRYRAKDISESAWPTWFQRALEEFQINGRSPAQMKAAVLKELEQN